MLAVLLVGQKYELKTLIKSCVSEARNFSLNELQRNGKRDDIDLENYQQITDGIIERLEKENKRFKVKKRKSAECTRVLNLRGELL